VVFKQRLHGDDLPLRGVIHEIPSAVATQAVAAAGADFVVIDREHGPIGREAMHAMIASTAGTGCAALVRVPAIDEAEVKVALDAGAEGIVFPLARTAEDVERSASYMAYPPAGSRGFGPFAAHSHVGTSLGGYPSHVDGRLTCCVLLETVEAVENIDAILAAGGIDLAVVAPYDLSMALGVPGQFDSPVFTAAVDRIERAVLAAGEVPLGGLALSREQSARLVAKGYRAIINAVDVMVLEQAVADLQTWR
jgi:4-hydroxy-2-oxoheptanedioate aldolase